MKTTTKLTVTTDGVGLKVLCPIGQHDYRAVRALVFRLAAALEDACSASGNDRLVVCPAPSRSVVDVECGLGDEDEALAILAAVAETFA